MAAKKERKAKKPPIDKESIQARLERALVDGLFVGVRRWIPNADRIDGFVVDIGTNWVAVAAVDSVRLDGWVVLRLKDIQAVFVEPDPDCFEIRVLRARGQWPPPATPQLDLSGRTTAITSAAGIAPMVAVHTEFDRPGICWEGQIQKVDDDEVRLLEVTPRATWHRKARAIDAEDITRIDFGGDYESALADVAGPPPAT